MTEEERKAKLEELQEAVLLHSNKLWLPKEGTNFVERKEDDPLLTLNKDLASNLPSEKSNKRALKLTMILNEEQQSKLNSWFDSCTGFYNCVVNFIKDKISNLKEINQVMDNKKNKNTKVYSKLMEKKEKIFYDAYSHINNWNTTRDELKSVRDKFITEGIPCHTLDNVVKYVCSSYKSSFSRHKSFDKFNVKTQRKNRNYKVMEFDYINWNKQGFLFTKLGSFEVKDGNKKIDIEQYRGKTCFIRYCKATNQYNLLVILPWKEKKEETETLRVASVDLGVRSFASVLSEQCGFQIETPARIHKLINKLDSINRSERLRKYKKRMLTLKYNRKVRQVVDQLHWETIKVLVTNFDNIIVGDISSKKISGKSDNHSNNRMMKLLSYTKFRNRLHYKCLEQDKSMIIIDESFTSKTCSNCSHFNGWLKGEKTLNCRNKDCNIKIDRDFNACRNMIFRCLPQS